MSPQRSMLGRTFGGDNPGDDQMIEQITAEFAQHPALNESGLVVTCRAGVVTLQGLVETHEEKALAEGLVKAIPGVSKVVNESRVKGGRVA
jgi:osmotically-inducible protein OsmY